MTTSYGYNSLSYANEGAGSGSERWSGNRTGSISSSQQSPPPVTPVSAGGNSISGPTPFAADALSQGSETDARYTDIVGKLSAWYHGSRYTVDELWRAVLTKNFPVLQKCLKAGLSVNYCRWVQDKSLGYGVRSIADVAVIKNDIRALQLLIEFKVDLTGHVVSLLAKHTRLRTQFLHMTKGLQIQEDQLWTTPLHEASKCNRLDMLNVLLDGAANPDTLDSQQRTSLFISTKLQSPAIAQQLLRRGASIELGKVGKIGPLANAAYAGNLEIVELLLEHGANIDAADFQGETAFCNAALVGNYDIMNTLAAHGAEVNVRNSAGGSPFFLAASEVKIDTMNALIKCGADVDFQDSNGCTALFRAVAAKNMPLLTYLLSRGADIDHVNHHGWTPLYAAMTHGEDQFVLFLLTNGCDTSTSDRYGNSPIHQAAMLDSAVAIRYILSTKGRGNTLSQENAYGETPLSLACKYDNCSVVKVLLKYGADPRHRDSNGFIALNRAMYHGSYASIRLLLQANPEIDHSAVQCLQQGRFDFPNLNGHNMILALLRQRYGIANLPNIAPAPHLQGILALTITHEQLVKQLNAVRRKVAADDVTSGGTPAVQKEDGSDDPFNVAEVQLAPGQIVGQSVSPGSGPGNAVKVGAVAGAVVGEVVVNQLASNLVSTLLGA